MEEIKIKGTVIKKSHVLQSPDFYNDETLIILRVSNKYYNSLIAFSRENDIKDLEITLRSAAKDATERAKRFFFALRDRLAEASGDISKSYKDHLYRSCIKQLMITDGDGKLVESLRGLDRKQLHMGTEVMLDWCAQVGANIHDLLPELEELRRI